MRETPREMGPMIFILAIAFTAGIGDATLPDRRLLAEEAERRPTIRL
jgi:hypothetical protein